MNIVITGGRAPVALELVRNFARHGHTVFVAESFDVSMARGSRYVRKFYKLPAPRYHEAVFVDKLAEILYEVRADILLPTCEEAFYISKNAGKLRRKSPNISIDVDTIKTMNLLHNKAAFIELAKSISVPTPTTILAENVTDITTDLHHFDHDRNIVLKPVYSRFGSRIVICKKSDVPLMLDANNNSQTIMQEFIKGELTCAYAYAHRGVLKVIVIYRGQEHGAGKPLTVFKQVHSSQIKKHVESIIQHTGYSGHISFDFIVSGDQAIVIECNPRVTSGVHILGNNNLAELFYGTDATPTIYENRQLFFVNLFSRKMKHDTYRKSVFNYKDSIFMLRDPLPLIWAIAGIVNFKVLAMRKHILLTEAMTQDIQWNGPHDQS